MIISKFKRVLVKLHWFLASQFGVDPQRFLRALRGLPSFLRNWVAFRNKYTGKMKLMPCLHDRYDEAGSTKSEYFWQDLLVARWIHALAPEKHVDVGSRVDGFVAHVASFREIEVFDVRPVSARIPGITFTQANLMDSRSIAGLIEKGGYCDSLSCLHALEHFGLGRYDNLIEPLGFHKGLENMAMLLREGGIFYLSTPIGIERVEFNANWVFDPRTIVKKANSVGLLLKAMTVINTENGARESSFDNDSMQVLSEQYYNLGIFIFAKATTR